MIKLHIEVETTNKLSQELIGKVLMAHMLTIEAYIKQLPGTLRSLETHLEGIKYEQKSK